MFDVVDDPRGQLLWMTHVVCCVYEYTQNGGFWYVVCHEFWVPVRPTQNYSGVGFMIWMSYYLVIS